MAGAVGGAWHEVVWRFQHGKDKDKEQQPGEEGPQQQQQPSTGPAPTSVDAAVAMEGGELDGDDPFALALAAAAARPGVSWLDIGERANGTLRCALELRARVAKNLEVRAVGVDRRPSFGHV